MTNLTKALVNILSQINAPQSMSLSVGESPLQSLSMLSPAIIWMFVTLLMTNLTKLWSIYQIQLVHCP